MKELILTLIFLGPAVLSLGLWFTRCKIVELRAQAPNDLQKKLAELLSLAFLLNTAAVLLSIMIFLAAFNNWWAK